MKRLSLMSPALTGPRRSPATDLAANGNFRCRAPHPADPGGQEILPQGDSPADPQAGPVKAVQADIIACLFNGLHQGLGVLQKALPGRCETGAGAVAYKQPGAQFVLQILDAGADVDWVTCSRSAASRKLPWAAMVRRVGAWSMSN